MIPNSSLSNSSHDPPTILPVATRGMLPKHPCAVITRLLKIHKRLQVAHRTSQDDAQAPGTAPRALHQLPTAADISTAHTPCLTPKAPASHQQLQPLYVSSSLTSVPVEVLRGLECTAPPPQSPRLNTSDPSSRVASLPTLGWVRRLSFTLRKHLVHLPLSRPLPKWLITFSFSESLPCLVCGK